MPDKFVRVPFSKVESKEIVEDELTANEMAQALVDAVKAKRSEPEKEPDELSSYSSIKEITEAEDAGLISPEQAERLRLKGRRNGLARL